MWKRADVDPAGQYRLLLTQAPSGARAFVLQSLDDAPPEAANLYAFTEQVPHGLLLNRDLRGISETVRLGNGKPFFLDAHGVWVTQEEMAAILERKRDHEIPWLNGIRPLWAPR